VILDHSVLVFDTHFTPEAGQALLASIRSVTAKPVLYVVNSHAHADHTHGNQAFPDAQLIGGSAARRDVLESDLPSLNRSLRIAQTQIEKLRQEMNKEKDPAQAKRLREQIKSREDYVQSMSRLKILAPVITIDDNMAIQDGTQEARMLFLGKGHTDGDVVLFLPAQKIAFLGDLFFNDAIPNVQDASILAWMKTLEEVLKLDAEKFVPGHGAIGSKKDVQKFLGYFQELQSLIKEAVDRGDSMEQVTGDITFPVKYSSYKFQNFFPSNVQKIYSELKALQSAPVPEKPPQKKPVPAP
jgi:cyclase